MVRVESFLELLSQPSLGTVYLALVTMAMSMVMPMAMIVPMVGMAVIAMIVPTSAVVMAVVVPTGAVVMPMIRVAMFILDLISMPVIMTTIAMIMTVVMVVVVAVAVAMLVGVLLPRHGC